MPMQPSRIPNADDQQRGVFRRAKPQGKSAERRRNHGQREDTEGAGDERADRCDTQRGSGTALLCHGVAVDTGHHRGGLAWNAHQDRGGRAAVLRAVVDASQHDDRFGGVEAECHRQQNADAGERPDAGQHADQGADHAAEKSIEQHVRPERDREAKQQAVDGGFHRLVPERHGRQRRFQKRAEQQIASDRDANADGKRAQKAASLDEIKQNE
jgi:hypothetical protein